LIQAVNVYGSTRRMGGFTLIEILVVMVLVALLASVVAFTVGQGNQRRELINEAKRLHGVLRMAADEAIYQNLEIGVVIDEEGYEFLGYDEDKEIWVSLPQPFLKARAFPDWMWLELNRDYEVRELPVDEESEEKTPVPEFVLLSSGEATPFRLRMGVEGDDEYSVTISSDGINEILYEEPASQ